MTLTVLEDIGELIDALLADSVCSNRVILAVIMSGCSCMRDLFHEFSLNEGGIAIGEIVI